MIRIARARRADDHQGRKGGALLQPMISGTEIILGASREGDYGHLIMFGLGGIYKDFYTIDARIILDD